MGTDIYTYAERKDESGKWIKLDFSPFDWRFYGMYGFIADVRNYAEVPSISELRGIPSDTVEVEEFHGDSKRYATYLTVEELNNFDYDSSVVINEYSRNMYYNKNICEQKGIDSFKVGETLTLRTFLGERFFSDLNKLNMIGAERVVIWFED